MLSGEVECHFVHYWHYMAPKNDSTLSPTEGSHEIALRLRELSALLPSW